MLKAAPPQRVSSHHDRIVELPCTRFLSWSENVFLTTCFLFLLKKYGLFRRLLPCYSYFLQRDTFLVFATGRKYIAKYLKEILQLRFFYSNDITDCCSIKSMAKYPYQKFDAENGTPRFSARCLATRTLKAE